MIRFSIVYPSTSSGRTDLSSVFFNDAGCMLTDILFAQYHPIHQPQAPLHSRCQLMIVGDHDEAGVELFR